MNLNMVYANVRTTTDRTGLSSQDREKLAFIGGSYLDFISIFGGAEGWFGEHYIKFWKSNDIHRLNQEYAIADYINNICLFGSDRCGNAFAINIDDKSVIQLPFIPFDIDFVDRRYGSFDEFVSSLEESELSGGSKFMVNPETFDKEIFEKHPIVLGGDPHDNSNKVLITNEQHIEAVVYFNKVVKAVKEQSR